MVTSDNRIAPWTFVLNEPLRILVVDDDPILREFATVYLGTPSTTIDTAWDGVAARVRLEQASYDMLLLDIEMPRLDGFSLLKEIRSDNDLKHLPVIMLTGHDDIASIDRAYQIGANSFATKPVNWRQLSYQIRYVTRAVQSQGPQAGLHGSLREPIVEPTLEMIDHDVCDFFQSILNRADALEQGLPADARARYTKQIWGVRSFAEQALAAYFGMHGSTVGTSGDGKAAVELDGGEHNRQHPGKRSTDGVELQQ